MALCACLKLTAVVTCTAVILLLAPCSQSKKVMDWLINPVSSFPAVTLDTDCVYNDVFPCIKLSNSLISRTFIVSPNFFTISYASHLVVPAQEIVRSPFTPECILGLNWVNYSVGGVSYIDNANTTAAFFDASFLSSRQNIRVNDTAFVFSSYALSTNLTALYEWVPGRRHSFAYLSWPPQGLRLSVTFTPPAAAPAVIREHIRVVVEYELLRGMPILTKRVVVQSSDPAATATAVTLTFVSVEYLKTNVPFGVGEQQWQSIENSNRFDALPHPGLLWIENDFAHSTLVDWFEDPDKAMFKANNYGGYEPTLLTYMRTDNAPHWWSVRLAPELPGTMHGRFESFRTLELVFDSMDFERQGMARRRLMTVLSPTVTENPIYTQTTNMSNASLHRMIDQCVDTGFELLALSFDSGFNMETTNASQLAYYQSIIDYATSVGIEIGGYDLEDMGRNISQYNHISFAGQSQLGLCFASEWYNNISTYYSDFMSRGMSMLITDGPYPGWSCASTAHAYHDHYNDSSFRQIYLQNAWFLKYRNEGVFIHAPDAYYYYGINRNKYPYDEYTTTLPRRWDLTIERQLMYDNSYIIPVTAGWMFLPMTAYHEGDSAAVFEPLHEHLDDYSFALGQYFSYSVAATIRGHELYDTAETKRVVQYWTTYYRRHRQILMSDIIHLRRPDHQFLDAILHVNHELPTECAMLIVFNPLPSTAIYNASIELGLYYSGVGLRQNANTNGNVILMSYMDTDDYALIELDYNLEYTLLIPKLNASSIVWWMFNCEIS